MPYTVLIKSDFSDKNEEYYLQHDVEYHVRTYEWEHMKVK